MKQQLMPKSLKKGSILYTVSAYTDEDTKKTSIDIDEWEVRTIQHKRGSQSKHGKKKYVEYSKIDDFKYVNLVRLADYTKSPKTGKWNSYIPDWCKRQFMLESERLPNGYYTTIEQAIKHQIYCTENLLKGFPEHYRKYPDLKDELDSEKLDTEKELRLLKTRFTKHKNKKTKTNQ